MEDQAKRLREIVKNIQKKKTQSNAKIITVTSGKGRGRKDKPDGESGAGSCEMR